MKNGIKCLAVLTTLVLMAGILGACASTKGIEYKEFSSSQADIPLTFKYPSDITFTEQIDSLYFLAGKDADNTKRIYVQIFTINNEFIEVFSDDPKKQTISDMQINDENLKISNEQNKKVNGFNASIFDMDTFLLEGNDKKAPAKFRYITFDSENHRYIFCMTMLSDDFDKEQKMINTVIDSVRIK